MDNVDSFLERAETQASSKLSTRRGSQSSSSSSSVDNGIDKTISRHPTHVDRLNTQRMTHVHTVGSHAASRSATSQSQPLPAFGGGKPYPPEIPAEREAYVVDFESPTDPLHPQNWPTRKKIITSAIGAVACLCSTFASSVFSAATTAVSLHFGVGIEVGSLASALYLVGYAVGPAIWAPLSELRGRKLPLMVGNFGFAVFATAVAVSKDIQTLMISRFFMGMFGSSPLVVVAAMYSDMYGLERLGYALVVFAASVFMGPMIAPFIGAFTVESYLGWRWDSYWSMIMGFSCFICIVFFVHETYPPVILIEKAAGLRRRTKNWAIHAKQEEIEVDLKELLSKNISRPIRMLVTEPILMLIGFYLSFVYGLMYIALTAYPFVFAEIHRIKPGVSSLPFFGMALGMILAAVTSMLQMPWWIRKLRANGGRPEPEWRLPLAIVGAVVFTIGLFWFGWTGNYRSVHWIVPTIAGVFIGFGLLGIFMQLIMYIIESYLMFAASAIAGNTIIRSLFAAACPLYDRQMFSAMHVNWAMTLLGCVALVMIPVPVAFYIYGPKLRAKSKFAPTFGPKKVEEVASEDDSRSESAKIEDKSAAETNGAKEKDVEKNGV